MLTGALVDAFTDRPFAGNPAGVVLLPGAADPAWMQAVAAEVGASETAFLVPAGEASYGLRWFTPVREMDLCGHATLAAAHWLWQRGAAAEGVLRFTTRAGELVARGGAGRVVLDFPAVPVQDRDELPRWREAFPRQPVRWVGRTATGGGGEGKALLVTDAVTLRALRPDIARLARLPVAGVVVTARSDDERYDVLSRYFAPACGVDEDPVTGSAHCTLASYWATELGPVLRARQVSPRGGDLVVEARGDRVLLTGSAVTVARLELLEAPVPVAAGDAA